MFCVFASGLTGSTVGIRIPGLLVNLKGTFRSEEADESRYFTAERQTDTIVVCTNNPCNELTHLGFWKLREQ